LESGFRFLDLPIYKLTMSHDILAVIFTHQDGEGFDDANQNLAGYWKLGA
jgi:hypothetical protein